METKIFKSFLLFGFLSWILSSCFENVSYPEEPIVTYYDFIVEGDSADLVFEFTDGNGDIGLEDNETTAPYDTSSYYYFNIYVQYYEKDDALGWIPGRDFNGDSIQFKYRIKPIIEGGKEKPLKGRMTVSIEPVYYNPTSPDSDTIKYKIQLIDRALNKSEWVETPEITR